MTMVRKTVTLDADAVAGALEFGDGNVSAYVNDAVMRQVRRDRLKRLVAEVRDVHGPIPENEIQETLDSIDGVWRE